MAEIPWSETTYHPEVARLKSIVGAGKINQEHWPSWARLVDKYSWRLVIKAADRVEPLNRWPAQTEHVCAQLAKDEAEITAPVPRPPPIAPSDRERRAKEFAEIMRLRGLMTEPIVMLAPHKMNCAPADSPSPPLTPR